MDWIAVLFVVALFIPGLCLILIIGREFRQRAWFEDQLRIEQELMARRSALRRISRRSAARPTGLAGEPSARASAVEAALAGEAAYRDSAARMETRARPDSVALGVAFESFLSVISESRSHAITTSQVDEAFEVSSARSPSQPPRRHDLTA